MTKYTENSNNKNTSNIQRLLSILDAEVAHFINTENYPRIENCISKLHLLYVRLGSEGRLDRMGSSEMVEVMQKISALLVKCFDFGKNDVISPIISDSPLIVVCSYPRSGNTMLTHLTTSVLSAQIFENMAESITPFSKKIYAKHYPYTRLIKDHVARPMYRQDRVAFVVRDGRDTMISLAYMTHKQGYHDFIRRDQLADFIRWLDKSYLFGGWAKHMRDVMELQRECASNKLTLRYEDFMRDHQSFIDFIRFLDPEHGIEDEVLIRSYKGKSDIAERVKSNPSANQSWGLGVQFEPDSLFFEWSQNRGGSSWCNSWDVAARKQFHETGATDFLMEYGYETDQNWWKN